MIILDNVKKDVYTSFRAVNYFKIIRRYIF